MKQAATGTPSEMSNNVWLPGQHCPELDGVRGIAIIMVTLYRFFKEVDPAAHPLLAFAHRISPIGERGVDLFFVLSGFLITGILLQSKSKAGYFRNFFVRRSLRIFPLYFTALLICLFLIPMLFGTTVFAKPRSEQAYLWTYLTNFRMSWLNEWCFGPLDHFWSLAVEEHFYFAWPVIVFVLPTRALLRLSLGIIVVVGIARTVAATRPELDVAVDVLTFFRCDSLCFGAVLAILINQGISSKTIEKVAKWTLPWMLLIAIGIAIRGNRLLTIPNSLCPAIWAILMAFLLTRTREHLLSRTFRSKALRWFGKYSYGMYVFQLPLVSLLTMSLFKEYFGVFTNDPFAINVAYVATMLLLTSFLAYISYHGFEKHFLKLKNKWH